MWQKLFDLLVSWPAAIFSTAVPKMLRMFLASCLAGLAITHAYRWNEVFSQPLSMYSGLPNVADWSVFATAFEISNAWLPVKETLLALVGLYTFRGTLAAVKFVEHVWDAVPFQ